MEMVFVLIMWDRVIGGIAMQEFDDEWSCREAMREISALRCSDTLSLVRVPKRRMK